MTALFADYQWLTTAAAAPLLAQAAGATDLLAAATALRRQLPAERAHLVLEQARLRQRATDKFPAAATMFFTPVGLEQATDHWVAAYKATRFAGRANSAASPVADLCCGIGGDTLALAEVGSVMAVDRDPAATLFTQANVRAAGGAAAAERLTTRTDVVQPSQLEPDGAWHLDPDRRASGRRTTHVELHEPGLDVIEALLARCPHAGIKLAPVTDVPPSWVDRCEQQWISRGRQCRQLVVWFGELAQHTGQRRATIVGHAGSSERCVLGVAGNAELTDRVERYVYEPDPAVLAAQLTGVLADEHTLGALTGGGGYLTGERPVHDRAMAGFEVLDVLPYDARRVRAWLAERSMGRIEVKKRGVLLEPERVKRDLAVPGDARCIVILAPIGGKTVAIMTRSLVMSAG